MPASNRVDPLLLHNLPSKSSSNSLASNESQESYFQTIQTELQKQLKSDDKRSDLTTSWQARHRSTSCKSAFTSFMKSISRCHHYAPLLAPGQLPRCLYFLDFLVAGLQPHVQALSALPSCHLAPWLLRRCCCAHAATHGRGGWPWGGSATCWPTRSMMWLRVGSTLGMFLALGWDGRCGHRTRDM